MADMLAPVPMREPIIIPQSGLIPPVWVRWLEALRLHPGVQGPQGEPGADAAAPQTTTLTVAVSASPVLTFTNMAPAGATVVGVTWRVSTAFAGTLTGLAVGDSVASDRWGVASAVTLGTTGGSAGWHGQGGFTVTSAYEVLAAPLGDGFGAAGALTCQCTWWAALLPPP